VAAAQQDALDRGLVGAREAWIVDRPAKRATGQLLERLRSSDLGVSTTSGYGCPPIACARSKWKYCDEVEQFATRMLPSAESCRKRSSRALECSGPAPSYACGSSSVSRVDCPHLAAPAAMNWSMMICAPLLKSPNCASQRTSASGVSMPYPYSKPRQAYSESGEL
jgi:hypothetical protein